MGWAGLALSGAGMISSLFGGGTQKSIQKQQLENMKQSGAFAGKMAPYASNFMDAAAGAMGPATSFYQRQLGSRQGAMEAAQNDIGGINDRFGAATKSAYNLGQRGGGRASLLATLPYQKARLISETLANYRNQAASSLLDAGSKYGSLAGQAGGMATGGWGASAMTGREGAEGAGDQGAAFYRNLKDFSKQFQDWWGTRKPKGGGVTPSPATGWGTVT